MASKSEIEKIRALLRHEQEQVAHLSESEMRHMLPVLRQAERELGVQLKSWLKRNADGDLRWTAYKYRSVLAQIKSMSSELERALFETLKKATASAQRLAVDHLVEQVARMSSTFEGTAVPLALNATKEIASARSFIIKRAKSSAERYGWGRKAGVAADMQRMLAVDVLKGAPVRDTVDRLARLRRFQKVVRRSIGAEEGVAAEHIPEALFKTYRSWARRIVITETSSAYGKQSQESQKRAAKVIPGLKRKWFADGHACAAICGPMSGQVVELNEPFTTPFLDSIDFGPAHPHCMCCQVPFKEDWDF